MTQDRITRDRILMDAAIAIEQQHGCDAVRWVAERTVAATLAGEDAAAARWRAIAVRLDELIAQRARG